MVLVTLSNVVNVTAAVPADSVTVRATKPDHLDLVVCATLSRRVNVTEVTLAGKFCLRLLYCG